MPGPVRVKGSRRARRHSRRLPKTRGTRNEVMWDEAERRWVQETGD